MLIPGHAEASDFVNQLRGEEVALVWRGSGTAIFLELGSLQQNEQRKGESCIGIEWSWRIQKQYDILLGSFNEDKEIEQILSMLNKETIESLGFFGDIPELEVQFRSGIRLLSFSTVDGNPEWSVNVRDTWLSFQSGRFVYEVSST